MRPVFRLALTLVLPLAATGAPATPTSLHALVEQAWLRAPAGRGALARQAEIDAARDLSGAWTAGQPVLGLSQRSGQWTDQAGVRESEVSMSAPFWTPGQRTARRNLAEHSAAELHAQIRKLRLDLAGDGPGVDDTPLPLQGVADGLDTEAIVWLGDGRFAIGTETQVGNRPSDAILLASLDKGVVKVTAQIDLPYRLWQMRARANDGIEGICAVDDSLLVSVETTQHSPGGRRYTPIGRYDLVHRRWEAFGVYLSSRIGKTSALTCRRASAPNSGMEVFAVERHFGISRLLRFRLPAVGAPLRAPVHLVEAEVVVDFGKLIDAVPNLEGLAFGPEGDLYVLSDNDFGIVTGPTQVVVIPAHMLAPPPQATPLR